MLILYTKTGCGYCHKVMEFMKSNDIDYKEKNVTESEEARNELLEKGGKLQSPYLVDTEKKKEMYESSDIIDYLNENYA